MQWMVTEWGYEWTNESVHAWMNEWIEWMKRDENKWNEMNEWMHEWNDITWNDMTNEVQCSDVKWHKMTWNDEWMKEGRNEWLNALMHVLMNESKSYGRTERVNDETRERELLNGWRNDEDHDGMVGTSIIGLVFWSLRLFGPRRPRFTVLIYSRSSQFTYRFTSSLDVGRCLKSLKSVSSWLVWRSCAGKNTVLYKLFFPKGRKYCNWMTDWMNWMNEGMKQGTHAWRKESIKKGINSLNEEAKEDWRMEEARNEWRKDDLNELRQWEAWLLNRCQAWLAEK